MKKNIPEFPADLQAQWFAGMEKMAMDGAENARKALTMQMDLMKTASETGMNQFKTFAFAKDPKELADTTKSQADEWQAFGEKAMAAYSDLMKDQMAYGQEMQAQWQSFAEKVMPKTA